MKQLFFQNNLLIQFGLCYYVKYAFDIFNKIYILF